MNAVALTEYYRSALAGRELPGAGLAWLSDRRSKAFAAFQGFPTTRDEDWKYTKVAAIEKRLFQFVPGMCIGLDEDDIEQYLIPGLDSYRLVFVNGQYMPMLSSKRSEQPQGFTVASLSLVLSEQPEAVESVLGTIADPSDNGFAALNSAEMADGACVILPAGQVADKPIQILYLTTAGGDDIVAQPRNLFIAGDNAQATIFETYASMGDSTYLTNAVTEVSLGANAGLNHYKCQTESGKSYHVSMTQVDQARDSRFNSHLVSLGAMLARHDLNSVFNGEGGECVLDGLYVTDGRQHCDIHSRVDHVQPHCRSDEKFKGVLGGRSRAVFNGKVYVHVDAQKTDASQHNANLLLSKAAEIDTKPQLEIYADDVKCAHGATVGQLDETAVFYLRSRGLDNEAARSLLTYAFVGEMVDRIPLAEYQQVVRGHVLARLPGGDMIRALM
ncbi:MAG TPA: Fe-S cluster assembly protein SufD [Chromatiaceae bacterium]|nr:Fe-S cluster assembly protein SufD [Chromatiaceae bacterium]